MEPLEHRPIALIGLMGAGKSAVARVLGERLGTSVADLDAMIEADEGGTVAELFERSGEPWFRRREGELLERIVAGGVGVIACGGGVVLDPQRRILLRQRCLVAWLEVTPAEAARRMAAQSPDPARARPLPAGGAPADRLTALLEQRAGLYASRALLLVTLLGALLASCGRPPRPGVALDDLAVRFSVARDHREALLGALAGEWTVRADGRGTGRLPTLPATLELASPDRARLRVSALLGVAFDVLVTRDSLFAWIPSQRMSLAEPGESLGIASPAAFAGRVIGATWAPPHEAWQAAAADSGGLRLGWREGGDSLALRIDPDGQPLDAWIGRDGRGLRVRYPQWMRVGGEPFPQRCELADDSGWARVRFDAVDVHAAAHADAGWFEPRRTSGWRTVRWDELKSALERRGLP